MRFRLTKRIVLMTLMSVLLLPAMPKAQLNMFVVAGYESNSGLWVVIEDINGDHLKVETTRVEVWIQLVKLNISGEERWVGGIVEEYVNEWGFRFDPNTIFVAEVTIEAIQTTIRGISENLSYWLGNQACVSAKVIEISAIRVPQDYPTIQTAINAANPGDTIFVSSGTYYEHVIVNKTVSLIGENRGTTIIDGSESGVVVYATANYVNISEFTIQNSGPPAGPWPFPSGICLDHSNNSAIFRNIIKSNNVGVILYYSGGNIITGNRISNNRRGIDLVNLYTRENTISGNTIILNDECGIRLLGDSRNNSIINNIISSNGWKGIVLDDAHNTTIINNTITSNKYESMWIVLSEGNNIRYNIVSNNGVGIYLGSSSGTIDGNTIAWNSETGLKLYYSSGRIYHNNFINNAEQVYLHEPSNIWDNGAGEGNYWSNYNGTDINGDGVGDTNIPWQGVDYYPLMSPWRALFQLSHPETISIFQAHLEINTYFSRGHYLIVQFYSYGGLYQGNVTVWNGTTPAYVDLSINVSHPLDNPLDWNERVPVENATLMLIDESVTIISSITTFVMTRSHLFERLPGLELQWIYDPPLKPEVFMEIIYIDGQWPYAPP